MKIVSYSCMKQIDDYFFDDSNTAFSSSFTSNSTRIDGDNDKVMEYAMKAIGENRLDDALIVVLINDTRYAGTCSMCMDSKESDIPNGNSIAYVPLSESNEEQMMFSTDIAASSWSATAQSSDSR